MNFVRKNLFASFIGFQLGIVIVMTALLGPSPVHASPKHPVVVMQSMEIVLD